MKFEIPSEIEAEANDWIAHYPEKASAVLGVLHAFQTRFGFISKEAIAWTAERLGLRPLQVLELVTFYPMFHQTPVGRFHLKVCRTLSCALNGAEALQVFFCEQLGLDPRLEGPQTTPQGSFTVEFVECLASCGTGPVVQCNEVLHETMTLEKAADLLAQCRQATGTASGGPAPAAEMAAEHGFEP